MGAREDSSVRPRSHMGYQLWISPNTGYRRRGTSFAELSELLERGLVASSIAEPLRSCAANDAATDVRAELERLDFDVAGVRNESGRIIGWVQRRALVEDVCGRHTASFYFYNLASDATPLIEIVRNACPSRVPGTLSFVGRLGNHRRGADLEAAVCGGASLWVGRAVGHASLYWTRELFPNDSWRDELSDARRTKVAEL